jgi:hypothetical protein
MRIPDEVIDMVKEEQMKPKGRGDPRGRGSGGRGRGGMPQRGECMDNESARSYDLL